MELTKVKDKEPIDQEWYLVYCPSYSESGHAIARWNKDLRYWESEGLCTPVAKYVEGYYQTPLSEL